MKLKFDPNQEYQVKAIQAVVDVFDGQELDTGDLGFSIRPVSGGLDFGEMGAGNQLTVSSETILENVRHVQERNGVAEKVEELQGMHFSVEMETGTGKTYVYLRTLYELHQKYGFKKFIIVTPSIAIREGVLKNLQITEEHFRELYGNVPMDYFVYDSKNVEKLRGFATANTMQVMIINIDSFAKDENVINRPNDRLSGEEPINFVKNTRPIVVLDEPQNMDTEKRKEAIASLNPLCTLRYSATHKNYYNLLYSLNPVEAYDLGLVKKIEVASVREYDSLNDAFIEVVDVTPQKTQIKAKLRIEVNTREGVKKKKVPVSTKAGETFDLYEISNEREIYKGYVVNGIDAEKKEVSFANGKVVKKGETMGELDDAIQRKQIEETVKEHLEKEAKLQKKGIKVLSLFFIDKVANYRNYEAEDEKGKFAHWFEEVYEEYRGKGESKNLKLPEASEVHEGYFSKDKKGRFKDSKTGTAQYDESTYELIMKNKERLLSQEEPLRFIFSHSALREGWDNPNVFQICTLNETHSEIKKRQEIGRGLRIPVDQEGERDFGESLNILTVIANESYEDFARQLQREIKEEAGVSFEGRVKRRKRRRRLKLKKQYQLDENFKELWNRIKHKTRYQVAYDTERLIESAAKAIAEMPDVRRPTIRTETARVEMGKKGVETRIRRTQAESVDAERNILIPDILGYLSGNTNLTKSTLLKVLLASGRMGDILVNPQQFLDFALGQINRVLQEFMIDGIRYEKIAGEEYEMRLFKSEEIESYLDRMYEVRNQDKTLYDYVVYDSETVEKPFVKDLESREDVKFYIKLPAWFKIETPIGSYNPDWGIVFKDEKKLYFVAETKDTDRLDEVRSESEKMKIRSGRKHFEVLDDVEFVGPVRRVSDIVKG